GEATGDRDFVLVGRRAIALLRGRRCRRLGGHRRREADRRRERERCRACHISGLLSVKKMHYRPTFLPRSEIASPTFLRPLPTASSTLPAASSSVPSLRRRSSLLRSPAAFLARPFA